MRLLIILSIVMLFGGCADVKTPTAQYAITHPLSTKTMVIAGTPKGEIIEAWGEPNEIIDMGFDDTGIKKEAWVYEAWFPKVPVDFRHLSRKKRIYFSGDYATGYEDIEEEKKEEGRQNEEISE